MSIELKLRRGTTTEHATFIGAEGEVTVDTDKGVLVLHDGVTPGGKPQGGATSAEPWNAITLLNGWVNAGFYYSVQRDDAEYRKDALGYVEIRGYIKGGTATPNTVLFTLPVGYRPLRRKTFLISNFDKYGAINIESNGNVIIDALNSGTPNGGISMQGIRFSID